MPLVERNHMVEQIPPATSDPTLGDSILPGAAERRSDRRQADIGDSITNGLTKFAVPIMNQELMVVITKTPDDPIVLAKNCQAFQPRAWLACR